MLHSDGMADKEKIQRKKNIDFLCECHFLFVEWRSRSVFCCGLLLYDLGILNHINEKEEQGFIRWNADPCGNAASDN